MKGPLEAQNYDTSVNTFPKKLGEVREKRFSYFFRLHDVYIMCTNQYLILLPPMSTGYLLAIIYVLSSI